MSGGYTIYTLLLTSAGSEFIPGLWQLARVLRAVDSTGAIYPQALIELRTGKSNEDYFPLGVGNAFVSKPGVDGVNIKWAAQSGITVTIGLSADASRIDWQSDPPAQVASISGTVATEEVPADTIVVTSNTIVQFTTLTIAARAARREVVISARVANTNLLWIRHAGAGAFGVELQPGATLVLSTTAAVEVHNPSTGSKVADVIELYDA